MKTQDTRAPAGVPGRSVKPFFEAFLDLKDAAGLSYREIARQAAPYRLGEYKGKPYTTGYMIDLQRGKRDPTPEMMEALAKVFGVDPLYFGEYRAVAAQRAATEAVERVGVERVLEALEALR